ARAGFSIRTTPPLKAASFFWRPWMADMPKMQQHFSAGAHQAVKAGILNSVLAEQVRNTASWLWTDPASNVLTAIFDSAQDEPLERPGALERALRLRLAAHYTTVATFVPTDVDAHIRHHMWLLVGDAETFARAKACIDEAVARDARVVSARVTDRLSGHDGEWFSVRAGALGRALALDLSDAAAVLAGEIDAELDREQRIFAAALERRAPATTTLALATTIAHHLGDLSRVVDAWPKAARASELCARYSRTARSRGRLSATRLPRAKDLRGGGLSSSRARASSWPARGVPGPRQRSAARDRARHRFPRRAPPRRRSNPARALVQAPPREPKTIRRRAPKGGR